MKTQIFKSLTDFYNREDKALNGVSQSFADENPEYEARNLDNEACWNCSGCSDCSDCSGCSGCSGCRGCRGCSDCSDLQWKDNQTDTKETIANELETEQFATFAGLKIPIIKNIHRAILDAVTPPDHKLNMSTWHTCGTTHCRAGWAVHLAGEEGYKLENLAGTCFAAMMIFKYSSPDIRVSPVRFFEANEIAYIEILKNVLS